MKESRDGVKSYRLSKTSSVGSLPLILDIDDFKVKRTWKCIPFFVFGYMWAVLRNYLLKL